MAVYSSRVYIKVKDDTTWAEFLKAAKTHKVPNMPSDFEEFLASSPTKENEYSSDQWAVNVDEVYDFTSSLIKIAQEKFILISDTESSRGENENAAVWYLGVDDFAHGGEPIVIDCTGAKINEEYLDFDITDFQGYPPACMITFMASIGKPVEWLRYGIGTGMIRLEESEDQFLKEIGINVHPVRDKESTQEKRNASKKKNAPPKRSYPLLPVYFCRGDVKKETEKRWMMYFGEYVTRGEKLSFAGKTCVISGAEMRDDWVEIEKKLLQAGAVIRSAVSGKTDYLICDPQLCGTSKADSALNQIEAGKPIKIILIEDVIKALSRQ